MKLTEKDNAFELSIIGYQFPNAVAEYYDANWLLIHLNISDPQGTWSMTDPCLLTYEASSLADWFDEIASGNFKQLECDFMEPVISFDVVEHDQQKFMRIRLMLETLPAWAQSQDEYFIEFAISAINLKLASNELQKQLEKYPERAKR